MRTFRRFPCRVGEGSSLGVAVRNGSTDMGDCSELISEGGIDDPASPPSSSSESDDSVVMNWRRLGTSPIVIPAAAELLRFLETMAALPPLGDNTSGEGEDDRVVSESFKSSSAPPSASSAVLALRGTRWSTPFGISGRGGMDT